MNNPERQGYNLNEFNRTLQLLRWGMENRVINNFTVSGPVKDVPTKFSDFVFLSYSVPGNYDESEIKSYTTGRSQPIEIYNKILALNDERLKSLKIPAVDDAQQAAKFIVSTMHIPYIAIAFGEIVGTKEKVSMMFSMVGMSPERALSEIQTRVRERKAKFN